MRKRLVNDGPGTAQPMAPLARLLAAYRTFTAPFKAYHLSVLKIAGLTPQKTILTA